MSRNSNYRNSRSRGGNGPDWGNNSNYGNNTGNYGYNRDWQRENDYEDSYDNYNRGYYNPRSENYGGNNYSGSRGYGNYGTGYGGGNMRNQRDQYRNNYEDNNSRYYNSGNYDHRDNDESFFERAGDRIQRIGERIKDNWNDWRDNNGHRDSYDSRYEDDRRSNYSHDDHGDGRNFIGRAANKVKEKWNEWTGHDDDHNERPFRSNYQNDNWGRHNEYPTSDYNRSRGSYENSQRNSDRFEPRYRNREQEEWSY
jgi:hypothetical protein